jgi:isopentenyl diphosphate isomerase/L-lactate dehydrogenase-like FMN-dependent dehydrogenase
MRNAVARPLMFQGGVQTGIGLGKALYTGAANPF